MTMRYALRDNAEERAVRLEQYFSKFKLNEMGRGDPIAKEIQDGIIDRVRRQVNPDGSPWVRNAESTIRRKGRDDPGYDSGSMLDEQNFRAEPVITMNTVTCRYAGSPDDVAKLTYFQGDNRYGIQRIVWGFDESMRERVGERLREVWGR